jgi:hypothetical protein
LYKIWFCACLSIFILSRLRIEINNIISPDKLSLIRISSFLFHVSFSEQPNLGKNCLINYVRKQTVNISDITYYSYTSHMCVRRATDVGIRMPLHNRNHFLNIFIYTNFPVLTEHLKSTKTFPPRTYRICFP